MRHKWTEQQVQYLKDNVATMTDRDIGEKLGIGTQVVKGRRRKLGLHKAKGGDIGIGQAQQILTVKPSACRDARYFDPHALDCWITGSPR